MSPNLPVPTASPPHLPMDVAEWRRRRLLDAGLPTDLVASLANQPRLDLHELLQLVDRGCPPELAAKILAPLPSQMRP